MEIISLNDFYKDKECKDINLYREYLNGIQSEITESLKLARKYNIRFKALEDLSNSQSFVDTLITIIDNSIEDVLSSSISHLSDEQINNIVFSKVSEYYSERANLIGESDKVRNEKNERNKTIEEQGYKESYYKAEDTEFFFQELKSAEEFVLELVNSNDDKKDLTYLFSFLDCEIEKAEEMADIILNFRKMAKYVTDKDLVLKSAITSSLTPEVLGKIVGIEDKCAVLKLFEDTLQNKLKLGTKFFAGLPKALQDEIKENGITESEAYDRLSSIYFMFKKNGYVAMPEDEKIKSSDDKLAEINERISELDELIEEANATDRHKLERFILSRLMENKKDGILTVSELGFALENHEQSLEEINRKITGMQNEVNGLTTLSENINEILTNSKYDIDFKILDARKTIRIQNATGAEEPSELVKPVVDAEKRRLEQYKIIIEAINSLNTLKAEIDEIDNSIVKKHFISAKRLREQLIQDYGRKCDYYYAKLKQKGLLHIKVSSDFLRKQEEFLASPADFKGLFSGGVAPLYEVSADLYAELREKNVVPVDMSMSKLNVQLKVASDLGNKLFTATTRDDGILEFNITDAELYQAFHTQEIVTELYRNLYDVRKTERANLIGLAQSGVSSLVAHVMVEIPGLSEGNMTKDELLKIDQSIKEHISSVSMQIAELNGKLPLEEEYSVEDYKEYQKLLQGFEDAIMLPTDVIETFNKKIKCQ